MGAILAGSALLTLSFQVADAQERSIKFSGREWIVKDGSRMGPGPNEWSRSCVWVDSDGRLHMKIAQIDGKWRCAEVTSKEKFGFGRIQFQVAGRIDKLDKNVVLGLFTYPTPDVGADGTNEIDIEFARWGRPAAPNGNFTVWPPIKGHKQGAHVFEFALDGEDTTHRIVWQSRSILFQSLNGLRDDDHHEISRFAFQPTDYSDAIPQKPVPLHINLWLFRGNAPSDGKEVEIIIKSVTFTPILSGTETK